MTKNFQKKAQSGDDPQAPSFISASLLSVFIPLISSPLILQQNYEYSYLFVCRPEEKSPQCWSTNSSVDKLYIQTFLLEVVALSLKDECNSGLSGDVGGGLQEDDDKLNVYDNICTDDGLEVDGNNEDFDHDREETFMLIGDYVDADGYDDVIW